MLKFHYLNLVESACCFLKIKIEYWLFHIRPRKIRAVINCSVEKQNVEPPVWMTNDFTDIYLTKN